MYKIGYRIKLPKDEKMQELFLSRYSTLFNTFELKITNDILCASSIENIVYLTNMFNIENYSFHLFKNAFYSDEVYSKTSELLMLLSRLNSKQNLILVTHCLEDKLLNIDLINELLKFNNYIFCIENIEVYEGLFEYLEKLKGLVERLNCYVCLDIGHLFFSATRCNEKISDVIKYISLDPWWKRKIKEIHLHDFNYQRCHLNIGTGEIDLNDIMPILNDKVPIILETKIKDLSKDGIEEFEYTKERLIEYGNTGNF